MHKMYIESTLEIYFSLLSVSLSPKMYFYHLSLPAGPLCHSGAT